MTDTATLARLTETVFAPMPQGVTVVETPPTPETTGARFPLYVSRVADSPRDDAYVGKVLASRPAATGDGWIAVLPDQDYMGRVYGAVLNPVPVNGKTYLVRGRVIVRYDDIDHAGNRHRPTRPYSILAGADGTPWPMEDDSIGALDPNLDTWFEVTFTAASQVSDVGQSEAEEFEVVVDNTLTGPMRGLGKPEENGVIRKNPPRVIGENYIVWTPTLRNPYIATWVDNGELGEFIYHGYLATYGTAVDFESTSRVPFSDEDVPELTWVKARMRKLDPIEDSARVDGLRLELSNLHSSFSAFNEALNEMADNRGHCSDYDNIIEKLGMETRTKEWSVEVSVEVSFVDSSPSSRVDSEIGSAYGIDIETTELRIQGRITTTVTVTASSEDSARDMVDSSEIEERIDSLEDLEIHDWTILSVERAD